MRCVRQVGKDRLDGGRHMQEKHREGEIEREGEMARDRIKV
jgi:hypothetical protein